MSFSGVYVTVHTSMKVFFVFLHILVLKYFDVSEAALRNVEIFNHYVMREPKKDHHPPQSRQSPSNCAYSLPTVLKVYIFYLWRFIVLLHAKVGNLK